MSMREISPLRQSMIDDMTARQMGPKTQKDYIRSCKRFTVFLGRSPETATADDIRRFQLDLAESALSIFNRNSIVTGVKFLFRVTLRRLDLVAEFYYVRQPITIPPVLGADEVEQLLTAAKSLRVRVMLSLAYGCGLRAGEVIRLRAGDIDSSQSERLSFAINAHSTSSASCSPRAARTGMSCCRPASSIWRASGGWSGRRTRMPTWRGRTAGCFPAAC